MTRRSSVLGPASRPVAVPDEFDDGPVVSRSGLVELPLHIRWSEPVVLYDMAQRTDRARVYEQVLREGTVDDVRRFVDPDDLVELFDDLVLPSFVRSAWSAWVRDRRRARTEC